MATLPNKTTWAATGNNPDLSDEITRRSVRIRMDTGQEHPEDRDPTVFRHAKLKVWAAENRGDLVWAALTLARAWIAAGAVPGEQNLGSFESWAACLGGILAHAVIDGFVGNLEDLRDSSRAEHEQMLEFLEAWFGFHGETPIKARDVGHPAEVLGVDPHSDKGKRIIGKVCSAHKDRRYGAYVLRKLDKTVGGVAMWQVLRAEATKKEGG